MDTVDMIGLLALGMYFVFLKGGVDRKLCSMLAFADVNGPLYGRNNRGVRTRAEAAPM